MNNNMEYNNAWIWEAKPHVRTLSRKGIMIARFTRRYMLVLLALAPVACGSTQGNEQGHARPPYELSPEEIRLARAIAERDMHLPEHIHSPLERIVFTKIDLLPDYRAGTSMRQVIVQHYRYRNDDVVLTTVDLNRLEVLSMETIPHFPTALAPEEMQRAERLARADVRLKSVFGMPGRTLALEGRPIQSANSQEPLFGHRVVHLLLRQGNDYLSRPRVLVDLTTETVLLEE